ncbi:hypothetical protein [uncultured Parasutterella sp.]|uniref:hypothetical protein n=1 Tax=uncultured Parasutterella sp. TaxID=1263098 RepID=UPI002599EF5E|nr:hypothetical protein [uncultured Parasutterella sp.]
MKTIFRYVLAALGYILLFLVLTIIFAALNKDNASESAFIAIIFFALIVTLVIRYLIKYKLKRNTDPTPVKPRIDNPQTTRVLELVKEIKSSDHPYEAFKEKENYLQQLKESGADLRDNDFYEIMQTIALDFANRREVPPEEWSQDITKSFPIVFQRNESAVFCAPYRSGTTYKNERKYVAGNRGVGIRVAKGVSFRVGKIAGKSISESVPVDIGKGAMIVTNKNIYYFDKGAAKKLSLAKIVGIQSSGKYLDIIPDGARAQPIEFCFDHEGNAHVMGELIKTQW